MSDKTTAEVWLEFHEEFDKLNPLEKVCFYFGVGLAEFGIIMVLLYFLTGGLIFVY